MVQQQRSISLNPAVMYRGVGANCINMGSCTMIQFVVGGKLKQTVSGGTPRQLTLFEEMSCGIGAGKKIMMELTVVRRHRFRCTFRSLGTAKPHIGIFDSFTLCFALVFYVGTVSALVGSPLELIMIQQQRKGGNVAERVKNILEKPSNVGRGFVGCAIREALWTCGYLSIPPVVRRTLMSSYPVSYTHLTLPTKA